MAGQRLVGIFAHTWIAELILAAPAGNEFYRSDVAAAIRTRELQMVRLGSRRLFGGTK